jgi:hypothetical protein
MEKSTFVLIAPSFRLIMRRRPRKLRARNRRPRLLPTDHFSINSTVAGWYARERVVTRQDLTLADWDSPVPGLPLDNSTNRGMIGERLRQVIRPKSSNQPFQHCTGCAWITLRSSHPDLANLLLKPPGSPFRYSHDFSHDI